MGADLENQKITDTLTIGDWIQATEDITEDDFMGRSTWVHARKGAVGHVLAVDGDWATTFWEREGTTTDAHVSQFKRLCSAGLGKTL